MLTASEYHMKEPVPLSRVHEAVFDFCRNREDAVVFGAQAVNAYVADPRMTQDVDLLSPSPEFVADALASHLHATLGIAARVRAVKPGIGYRVFQLRKDGNRHLADVRLADMDLGELVIKDGIRYTPPALTLAMKVCALYKRRFAPKGATDLADVRRLLIAYPELRVSDGTVASLVATLGSPGVLALFRELIQEPIVTDQDVDEGY